MSTSGIVALPSPVSFSDTVTRLVSAFQDRGIRVFAVIDQHCKHWAYPSPAERVEIVIFSEEMPTGKDLEDFLQAAMVLNDEAPAPAHTIAISDGSQEGS